MKKRKISPFDWNEFIVILSDVTSKPKPRDLIYENTKELNKKEIPDFKDQFILRSREISFKEREEYYNSDQVDPKTIRLIEEFSAEFAQNGSYDIDTVREYDRQFKKLLTWFHDNNKSLNLTKVWLYSLGRENINLEIPYMERLYILNTMVNCGVINGNLNKMSAGGEPLCKLLAVIMGAPSFTSLEGPLRNLGKFLNEEKASNEITEDRKRLVLIHSIFQKAGKFGDGATVRNALSSLDDIIKKYG